MPLPGDEFWSPRVRALQPYVPGEQPRIAGLVKLNTNENPYPPSPAVLDAILQAAGDSLALYPDPESLALRQAIADRHGLTPDQVFVGNGSDEVLAHAFFAFFQQPGQALLFPDITYTFYRVYAQLYGIEVQLQPVDEGLRIDVGALAERARQGCAGIVLANPNAPTGIGLPLVDIERLLASCPRVVLVDEAYVDFGGESAMALIARHPNLLVVQTLSKARSLAGLRVGFACGQAHLIEALTRVKNSFNSYPLDRLAQAGAVAAIEDEAWFRQTRDAVVDAREGLVLALEDLGFELLPSQANFVFARHPVRDAGELAAALRQRAVLVRHFRQPRIEQFMRISVGTRDQCAALISALRDILLPASG